MKTVINWDVPLVKEVIRRCLLKAVVLSALITIIGVFGIVFFNKPTYTTSVQLSQNDNNIAQISTYAQYMNTPHFKNMLKTEVDKSQWKNDQYDVGLDYSNDSVFFSIQATSKNPRFSQYLANHSMLIFNRDAGKYLSGVNVSLVSRAKVNNAPNPVKFTKIAIVIFIISFMAFLTMLTIFMLFKGTIVNNRFINLAYGISHLGDFELK